MFQRHFAGDLHAHSIGRVLGVCGQPEIIAQLLQILQGFGGRQHAAGVEYRLQHDQLPLLLCLLLVFVSVCCQQILPVHSAIRVSRGDSLQGRADGADHGLHGVCICAARAVLLCQQYQLEQAEGIGLLLQHRQHGLCRAQLVSQLLQCCRVLVKQCVALKPVIASGPDNVGEQIRLLLQMCMQGLCLCAQGAGIVACQHQQNSVVEHLKA